MAKAIEINFEKIKIELLTDYFDVGDAEAALSRCHPLGAKRAMAHRLYYAASYRGEWIAVLLFDGAVRRNKHREARIGWSKSQVDSRLKHIANNSRFLMMPRCQGVKNLASKILSLVTDRISGDWLKHHGETLLALETYVDPVRNDNQGTCYTAAGWERLGMSSGYEAYNQERTHGKWYFLKSLHKDSFAALRCEVPHALLTGVKNVSGESNNNYVLDASKIDLEDLKHTLEKIKDPRGKQGRIYPFVPFLSLCICAVVSGYTQYRQIADWISRLPADVRVKFGLRGDRIPDETTISFFIRKIDPKELQEALQTWLLKTYKKGVSFTELSIDGKALRATSADPKEQKGFLNIFATELGIVIDHVPTMKGGGEKKAAREFLNSDKCDLSDKIVLADALHTDRKIIETLEKKTPRTSSLSKTIRKAL